jgi:peptidoglycan/LPS O-acetylase OafA/YrhL
VNLSYTVSHLLILPYIPWFVCGIMIYRLTQCPDDAPRQDLAVLCAAIILLGVDDGAGIGLLAASLSLVLWAAAKGKLPMLANPVLAWLGAISYTLYLLHENIGWGVIMQAEKAGIDTNLSILLTIGLVLAMATALTRLVERPAMKWLRDRYRARGTPVAPATP